MRFAIVETGYKPGLYTPTVICDEIGIGGDCTHHGSYSIVMSGTLITIHVYTSDSHVFNEYVEMDAEVFVLTDTLVISDLGRSLITNYIRKMMATMLPNSRLSPMYRFKDYYIGDLTRYTFRFENDVTKDMVGLTTAGYVDMLAMALLISARETKLFLSEPRTIGRNRVCIATVVCSTYLEALCAEMMYAQDVLTMEA